MLLPSIVQTNPIVSLLVVLGSREVLRNIWRLVERLVTGEIESDKPSRLEK
jgi:hypothetical protein